LGLAIKVILDRDLLPNYLLSLRIDMGTLGVLVGVFLSLCLLVLWGIGVWLERQYQDDLAAQEAKFTDEHAQFLRRLDHELKNPLTAIQAGLANLTSGSNEETLESVQAQTQRLSRLVSDLRKLADLETRPIDRGPVDMTGLLAEALSIVNEDPEAGYRAVNLNLPRAPWPLPEVMGDEDLLLLAVLNILDNAVKFTQPGATIEVRAFEDSHMVTVEVADTGSGIPDEELPFVWQELYRGRHARGIPGSGLGLALVRAIAEKHGGQVSIRSRINTGTVVTLKVPIADVTRL
jgi:signal transduction histidine kinase